jgi:hypothetical protein
MYFACSSDQTLFAEHDLSALLSLIRDVLDCAEDTVVYYRNRVVCVVHGPDHRITWLDHSHRPATVAA